MGLSDQTITPQRSVEAASMLGKERLLLDGPESSNSQTSINLKSESEDGGSINDNSMEAQSEETSKSDQGTSTTTTMKQRPIAEIHFDASLDTSIVKRNTDSSESVEGSNSKQKEKEEEVKTGPQGVPNRGCPLHPEVDQLREEFWSKYTPASLRLLLLEDQNERVKNILLIATTLMFSLPVGVMYLAFHFGLSFVSEESRWVFAAISAVVTVNVLLITFSIIAYKEECKNWQDKLKLDQVKKEAWENRKKLK